jgi:hypothetical protein
MCAARHARSAARPRPRCRTVPSCAAGRGRPALGQSASQASKRARGMGCAKQKLSARTSCRLSGGSGARKCAARAGSVVNSALSTGSVCRSTAGAKGLICASVLRSAASASAPARSDLLMSSRSAAAIWRSASVCVTRLSAPWQASTSVSVQARRITRADAFVVDQRSQQRRRVSQTRGFDHHAFELAAAGARKAPVRIAQGLGKVAAQGTADAAAGQFDHGLLCRVAHQQMVERCVTVFVDDDQRIGHVRLRQKAVEQRGLAAAQETGQQHHWNMCRRHRCTPSSRA